MTNLYKVGLYKYLRRKGKVRKAELIEMYMNLITLVSAAEYDYNTPDYNKYQYEQAISTGCAAFYKCKEKNSVNYNKWCCTPAFPAAVIDNMGVAKQITTHGSDYALTLTVDTDCILIYNNSALYPDYIFTHYAEQLAETDVSMDKLIKWSRMNPIPKATSDTDIAKYTTALQRIIDGDDITVISDELAALSDGHKTIDDNVLRLTDESAIDKMHFLDEHHEQLVRRLATLGGLPFSTTAKSAQNLTDELHDMDALSTFIMNDRIACREEGFKRAAAFMQDKYGESFDFAFKRSDVLEKQMQLAEINHDQEELNAEKTAAEIEQIEAETAATEAAADNTDESEVQTDEGTETDDNAGQPDNSTD